MKKLALVVLGALLASFLVLAPGVGAQDDEFTINPDEGVPGDPVATRVDPDAVERECITDLDDFPDEFAEVVQAFADALADAVANQDADLATLLGTFNAVLAAVTTTAAGQGLLDQLFVLTFARIADQEPVGEMANWDPETGEGTIDVPDIDPGLWVIAAVCLEAEATEASLAAAIEAGAAYTEAAGQDFDPQELFGVMIAELLVPRYTWTHPFTIPLPRPEPDPSTEVFCAVLPALQPLGAQIIEAFGELPDDEGLTQEQWESAADWDEVEETLRALMADAIELLDDGDRARADEVAPQWDIVTAPLRDARNALEAVNYDLSTESGRQVAAQLRAAALDESEDPEGDAALEALTNWFFDNCLEEPPPPEEPPTTEAPREPTPAAAPLPLLRTEPATPLATPAAAPAVTGAPVFTG